MRKPLPLASKSNNLRSRRMRENTINCYVEGTTDGSFRKITRCPQFSHLSTVGSGPIRAMTQAGGNVYLISGNEMYRCTVSPISGALTSTLLGTVVGSSGSCQIAAIGGALPQVLAVTNGVGYLWTESSATFAQVVDPDFIPGYSLTSYNERFWVTDVDTANFRCSDIYPNGGSWNALNFDVIDNTSDLASGVASLNTEVYVFGRKHLEVYQDNGLAVGFPVSRINGATKQRGCLSPQSIVRADDKIYWLADDLTIRSISGGVMEKVSDLALEQDINTYIQPQYAFAQYVDYTFYKAYCITFPHNNVTWCYELHKGTWHQRKSIDIDGWRIGCSAKLQGFTLLGDRFNGKIYKMDFNVYSEDGADVLVEFVTPPLFNTSSPVFVPGVELICDVGVGDISSVDSLGILQAQPIDPKMSLDVSRDGGYNFTSQPFRSLGRIGNRTPKLIWRNIGYIPRGDDLVLRFRVSDPVELSVYELYGLNLEAGVE